MNDDMLNFVKNKLEKDEGITPKSLASILAAARKSKLSHGHSSRLGRVLALDHPIHFVNALSRQGFLLAVSCALLFCGWLVHTHTAARREANLCNIITLLCEAENYAPCTRNSTSVDCLLSWQDAPCSDISSAE